jgi:membrane-associated protease RseP (regulator of RpoE activity)
MKNKILAGSALSIALLVAGAGVFRSQEMAEPPDPPDAPEAPEIFLLNDGSAHLGVMLGEVTPQKAQELKLAAVAGAIIIRVEKESPAAQAGLEKDDVIVEFDGARVRSSAELHRLVRETPSGRAVAIKVMRGGQARTLSAKLEAPAHKEFKFPMPEMAVPSVNIPEFNFSFGPGHASLGISGDDLTSQLAQYFGVKQGKGVFVREVTVGSAAEKAGLKAGDVIAQVDGKTVSSVDELRAALNDNFTDDTRKVNLSIVRDHHEQTLTVELTRSLPRERHAAAAANGLGPADSAPWQEQAGQVRAQADQLRREMEKQKVLMQGEWQHQLREQMRQLREQLKALQDVHISRQASTEI